MQTIEIPIAKRDIEMLKDIVYNNNTLSWIFPDKKGKNILIEFMSQDEYDQRKT